LNKYIFACLSITEMPETSWEASQSRQHFFN